MTDYPSETEDKECIFCEIAKGNIKPLGDGMIYEDEDCMAWLSPFPNTKGFAVVATKKHFPSDVLSMPGNEFSKLIETGKKVSEMLVNYFEDVGRVGIIIEGMGINHAHIKLFPMHGTGELKKGEWKQYHSKAHPYFEEYEGYLSSNDGPQADFGEIKALAEKIRKK